MPFAVSDNESDAEVDAPVSPVKEVIGDIGDEEEEEDVEEEEEGEEVYAVEKILSHRIAEDGKPRFEIKWVGYEKKSDRTWEPEENLVDASLILTEYLESIGGREQLYADNAAALKTKKRGRASTGATAQAGKRSRKNGDHPSDGEPPATARAATWKPPAGSWEDHIAQLDACEDEETGKLMVYLTWKNGHKTQHETSIIYQRCPQKMLQFYERHVRIIKTDADAESNASLRD
ncbi:putative heterochromatin factor HP1 [Podospora conica]|nr:putative heterochromatin factor HP1 [Schizothecium conicum]